MLPILLLLSTILIQFESGDAAPPVTTRDPGIKCELNWEAEYHPENRTLRTVIDYPTTFTSNRCYDFFYLGSYDILLNAEDGQNVQAVKLNKNIYGYETYIFHDVEPCRSYEMVLTLVPQINYFEDFKYEFAFDYEYKKIIETGDCEETVSYTTYERIVEETDYYYDEENNDTTSCFFSSEPELKAEYRPKDGGSVAVWFEKVPEYDSEMLMVSWGLSWGIVQSKIVRFDSEAEYVFHDMDLYMSLFDSRNKNPCKEIDLVLQPCYNLSNCAEIWNPLVYFFMDEATVPTVHEKVNFCVNTTSTVGKDSEPKNGKDLDVNMTVELNGLEEYNNEINLHLV